MASITPHEIEQFLRLNGPSLSSEIAKHFVGKGLTPEAARQRITRSRGTVTRLSGINFPRKEKFLYLEDHWGKQEYWRALLAAFRKTAAIYGTALDAIAARGGALPITMLAGSSGSPLRQRGHIGAETVFKRLLAIGAVSKSELPGLGNCIVPNPNLPIAITEIEMNYARYTVETTLLLAVRDWARKLGLASYNKINIRDKDKSQQPTFGTTQWDLVGPSYLQPLVKRSTDNKVKPGSLVCDVFVGGTLETDHIQYFIRKCSAVSSLRNMATFLPIIVADRFTPEAFNLGRSKGVVMATPGTLFGEEVASGLSSLLKTLNNAAAMAVKNPDVIQKLFSSLSAIEGAAANIRGDLFEMIVGHLVHKREGYSVDIGPLIKDRQTGAYKEIDVRGVRGHERVWHCECKGHQPDHIVSQDEIEEWLERKVPFIHRVTRETRREWANCEFIFEFWTCGHFDPTTLDYLKSRSQAIKKYRIGWKDGDSVREYAKESKIRSIIKTLEEQYFRNPLRRELTVS